MAPTLQVHLPSLERLLGELFNTQEVRRFVANQYGRSIADQLPEEGATKSYLAHVCAIVLDRNGVVGEQLFDALVEERPERREEIYNVAKGVSDTSVAVVHVDTTQTRVTPRTPDYVIKDSYDANRSDRDLVRDFLGKHISLTRLICSFSTENHLEIPTSIAEWVRENCHKIKNRKIRQMLEQIGSLGAAFRVELGAGFLATAVSLDPIIKNIAALQKFAALTDVEVHQLTLESIEL